MRARITAKGTLIIEPENEMEAFALMCWDQSKHCLHVVSSWPVLDTRNISND